MKKISKEKEQEYNKIINEDVEKWDNKELGADPAFAKKMPEFAKKKSITTTIRMSPSMVEDLKKKAEEEGMPYQTLIKHVLTKYLKNVS